MKRFVKFIAIVAAGLLLAAGLLYLIASSGAFARGVLLPRALAGLGYSGGAEVVKWRPFSRLEIEGLTAEDGRGTEIALERLRVKYRLLPVLARRIEISELTLNGLQLEVAPGASAAPQGEESPGTEGTESRPWTFDIRKVHLNDAEIGYLTPDEEAGTFFLRRLEVRIPKIEGGTQARIEMSCIGTVNRGEVDATLGRVQCLALMNLASSLKPRDLVAEIDVTEMAGRAGPVPLPGRAVSGRLDVKFEAGKLTLNDCLLTTHVDGRQEAAVRGSGVLARDHSDNQFLLNAELPNAALPNLLGAIFGDYAFGDTALTVQARVSASEHDTLEVKGSVSARKFTFASKRLGLTRASPVDADLSFEGKVRPDLKELALASSELSVQADEGVLRISQTGGLDLRLDEKLHSAETVVPFIVPTDPVTSLEVVSENLDLASLAAWLPPAAGANGLAGKLDGVCQLGSKGGDWADLVLKATLTHFVPPESLLPDSPPLNTDVMIRGALMSDGRIDITAAEVECSPVNSRRLDPNSKFPALRMVTVGQIDVSRPLKSDLFVDAGIVVRDPDILNLFGDRLAGMSFLNTTGTLRVTAKSAQEEGRLSMQVVTELQQPGLKMVTRPASPPRPDPADGRQRSSLEIPDSGMDAKHVQVELPGSLKLVADGSLGTDMMRFDLYRIESTLKNGTGFLSATVSGDPFIAYRKGDEDEDGLVGPTAFTAEVKAGSLALHDYVEALSLLYQSDGLTGLMSSNLRFSREVAGPWQVSGHLTLQGFRPPTKLAALPEAVDLAVNGSVAEDRQAMLTIKDAEFSSRIAGGPRILKAVVSGVLDKQLNERKSTLDVAVTEPLDIDELRRLTNIREISDENSPQKNGKRQNGDAAGGTDSKALSFPKGLWLETTVAATEVKSGEVVVEEVELKAELREQILRITQARGEIAGAPVELTGMLNLADPAKPRYNTSATAETLPAGSLLTRFWPTFPLTVKGGLRNVSLSLDGSGLEQRDIINSLNGLTEYGVTRLEVVDMPSWARLLSREVMKLLHLADDDLRFNGGLGKLTLRDGRIVFDKFELDAELWRLSVSGEVPLDGSTPDLTFTPAVRGPSARRLIAEGVPLADNGDGFETAPELRLHGAIWNRETALTEVPRIVLDYSVALGKADPELRAVGKGLDVLRDLNEQRQKGKPDLGTTLKGIFDIVEEVEKARKEGKED